MQCEILQGAFLTVWINFLALGRVSNLGAAACLQHTNAFWPPREAFQGISAQSTPGKNCVGRIAVVDLVLKAAMPP